MQRELKGNGRHQGIGHSRRLRAVIREICGEAKRKRSIAIWREPCREFGHFLIILFKQQFPENITYLIFLSRGKHANNTISIYSMYHQSVWPN